VRFFDHQAKARSLTWRLLGLFLVALIFLCWIVQAIAGWAWNLNTQALPEPRWLRAGAALALVAVVLGGAIAEWWRLCRSGAELARLVGARRVSRSSKVAAERQLLNLVDEMSVASGCVAPPVFLMDHEPSINAFAAGLSIKQSVIVVSAGALAHLNREEMMGVLAHEFSHVLNGDGPLNVRLIAVLHGLLLVHQLGRRLLGTGDSWKFKSDLGLAAVVIFFGAAVLCVVGYLGLILGKLIRAAVARQREYLADASAVQWTRNPHGLGQALRKILALSATPDGDRLRHPGAELVSHLFIHAPVHRWGEMWLATHPPLADRIKRVYGRAMGPLTSAPVNSLAPSSAPPEQPALAPAQSHAWIRDWQHHLTSPDTSAAAISGLVQGQQAEHRIAKLGLALPVLRQWPTEKRRQWIGSLRGTMLADAHLSASEFVVLTLLQHHLDPPPGSRRWSGRKKLDDLLPEITELMHWIAQPAAAGSERLAPRDFQVLERSLGHLNALAPLERPILLRRLAHALEPDSNEEGHDVVRALAILLDCPMPARSALGSLATSHDATGSAPVLVL
jgi:Zn-dependent protease with chaperone function